MGDPSYVRTTRSRNKANKRAYRPLEVHPHHFVDTRLRRYVQAPDGALVRVKGKGE